MLNKKLLGSVSSLPQDDNFENVTLLLNGDGTNGAQNNTFVDSSTNNFTITRNGNTTQGSFSPYGTLWSNYFDGNGDYLNTASTSALNFGTGDYTVEVWACFNSSKSYAGILDGQDSNSFNFYFSSTGTPSLIVSNRLTNQLVAAFTPTLGVWYHIAVSRQSGTLRMFVNGSQIGSTSNSTNYSSSINFNIGGDSASASYSFDGYLSNLRAINGTALYTSAFTPPTAPLTAISGTALLTCQSNRFIDNSSNALALTVVGNPSVQRFSPFEPTAPYSTNVIGGSGYFDGSGDYLVGPTNSAFAYGTGDFTIEAWVNFPSINAQTTGIFDSRVSGNEAGGLIFIVNTSRQIAVYSNTTLLTASTALQLNTWNHVAVTRSGTTLTLWLNGASVGTTSNSTNFTTQGCYIGSAYTGTDNLATGYISNLRVVKGTAVYTSAFTPPTSPVTAIANTSLLANFTNAGITDLAMQNNLETVGNAQVSTSVKKYGTGSLSFDGTGDYLTAIANPNIELGSGDYTVECWINISAAASNGGVVSKGPVGALGDTVWSIEFNGSANTLSVFIGNANNSVYIINGTTNVKTSTWVHVALTRSGNNTRFFINGTQEGSTYTSGYTIATGQNLYIGGGFYAPSTRTITGYIDDLRITKGVARYTANFTPPATNLPTY